MAGMALSKAFFFDACGNWLQKTLAVELNTNIVHALSDKVMINSNFYRVKNTDGRVTDIDVRIADDVNVFSVSNPHLILTSSSPHPHLIPTSSCHRSRSPSCGWASVGLSTLSPG